MVYVDGWEVADEATANPKKDWTGTVRGYFADPFAAEFLQTLDTYRTQGWRSVGHTRVAANFSKLNENTATLSGCVDTSHVDVLNASGQSIKTAEGPGFHWRYVETATISLTPSGWRLVAVQSDFAKQC
jgi:hypothetical protein